MARKYALSGLGRFLSVMRVIVRPCSVSIEIFVRSMLGGLVGLIRDFIANTVDFFCPIGQYVGEIVNYRFIWVLFWG